MQNIVIAKVAVDKTAFGFDILFSYIVPQEFVNLVQKGIRVLVPFGTSNQKRQAVIFELIYQNEDIAQVISSNEEKKIALKPILAVIDEQPVLNDEMFSIIEYMVTNTFCTYYDAVKTVIPAGIAIDISKKMEFNKEIAQEKFNFLSADEKNIVMFLQKCKSSKEVRDILDCSSSPKKSVFVNNLIELGIVTITDIYKSKSSKKTQKIVELVEYKIDFNVKLTKLQQQALDVILQLDKTPLKQVIYLSGTSMSIINALKNKGLIRIVDVPLNETYDEVPESVSLNDINLNEQQNKAFCQISELLNQNKPAAALLYGVTGSGKTQVYIKLIESVLNSGRQALLLVPEISLTPQTVSKFKSLFGHRVALLHSGLSTHERLAQYNKIKSGFADIVIGTRSAVFAPLSNIGLIIMDEEGESSYKSENSPRYHARDIAKKRCLYHNSCLVLGSATPSVQSYYNAINGKYKLVTLEERFSNASLPDVYLVDMRTDFKIDVCISDVLSTQISDNLQKKEQTILFVNRRGFNTYATCMDCGGVISCPNCDVAMTYHKVNGFLMCHYCGYTHKYESECKICKSKQIKLTGIGTQKLQDDLLLKFPQARVLRMDTDTIFSSDDYEQKFSAFQNGEYDILIGTQMVAKGLNFPNVTLVGVITADNGLSSDNYNSSERIFSLITQVVGRSGRNEKAGRAYLQTYNPENPIIVAASNQDYKSFYNSEIEYRKSALNPPFCDICVIGFSGNKDKNVKQCAMAAMSILKALIVGQDKIPLRVLGPSQASIYKLNNKFRYKIIIKCKFNQKFKLLMAQLLKEIGNSKFSSGISFYVDVNGDINY
ncbi:MAG: primosomal protein N' [Oscillospiraceae bacterium]